MSRINRRTGMGIDWRELGGKAGLWRREEVSAAARPNGQSNRSQNYARHWSADGGPIR